MARMDGEYILHGPEKGYVVGNYEILKKRYNSDVIYETVIPDAGNDREFALGLVDLLNSQGSQTGVQESSASG